MRKKESVRRFLLIEDNELRITLFKKWVPINVRLVVASSAGKAMGILQRDRGRAYAGIMLDHDLQEQNITLTDRYLSGSDLVRLILRHISRTVPVLVHSMNVSRGPLIAEALEAGGFLVTRIPMSELSRELFLDWIDEAIEMWIINEG